MIARKDLLLLTPGPVLLNPSVQTTLSQPMWHHRSPQFKKVLKEVSSNLKMVFQTKEPVLILTSTGTGAMEAAISNTLSPGDEVLCICAGKFGERWRDIAMAFDIKVHSINVPLGSAVHPDTVKNHLKENKQIKALFISACETSTATQQPVQDISRILRNHPHVLFIVDGITALGAEEMPMDRWGLDVLIAGSQKSFMLPTGLAFIALSKKAWRAVEKSSCLKYYFDLKKERLAQAKGQTAFSSSVTLIRALKESLTFIKKQGLHSCIEKCQNLKKSTHIFCKEMGLPLYSLKPANSVTAIKIPDNLSVKALKTDLQNKHAVVVAGGQGELKNKIIRIGHLGHISHQDHLRGLKALAKELSKKSPNSFNNKKIKTALKKAEKVLHNYSKN